MRDRPGGGAGPGAPHPGAAGRAAGQGLPQPPGRVLTAAAPDSSAGAPPAAGPQAPAAVRQAPPARLPFPTLQDALAWLDGHVNFEAGMPSRRSLPTLDRMRELATLLGDPELAFPSVHLTGTNGKGSTAAMTTALLGAMGLSVGTYTSPNLSTVNERLSRNGEPIGDADFAAVLSTLALLEPSLSERPTRFELLTAAALRWFGDQAVDAAVVEVGLGGTWDSTNIVDGVVAVITNISYDHTDVLGPTLDGIARDKAGIVKPGSVAVVGETDPDLVAAIRTVADQAGAAQVWVRGVEFDCTANRLAVGGRLVDLRTPGAAYGEVLVPLHGAHQGLNAACALAAAEAFFGAPLDGEVVQEAFSAVRVPGRLEVVGRRPLWVVDGAHNVAGMAALAAALADEFSVDGPKVAVVGMLTGRDPTAMLTPLAAAGVGTVVACAPDSPRAMAAADVAAAAGDLGLAAPVAGSVADAVDLGRSLVPADGLLVVCGSLYVAADGRRLLLPG
ncbi:MAG TPA: folylpolyglutamate synthase/dihydrofolate synthase family protein [Acidimicrobiales bacterium]|nr:folylpolyglutamate synthase/dihydrofolate synthase family protein [Acidimicrobiales bacterium]